MILKYLLCIFTCYFIGSIPFALIFGKILKGIDVRNYGSGNLGGTNIARVISNKWGIIVIICDIMKGFFSVFVGYFLGDQLLGVFSGVSSIIGHMYPIFANFKGGKGVATGAGVFMFLAPINIGISFFVFFIIFKITRYISLSSIIAILTIIITIIFPCFKVYFLIKICALLIGILIIYKHKKNIKNLLNGKEKKIL